MNGFDPIEEYDKLVNWLNLKVGEKTQTKPFVHKLSAYLNMSGFPVKVKGYPNVKELDKGDYTIGAEYSPDLDEIGRKPFLFNFFTSYSRSERWEITEDIVEPLALEIVEILVHEYQHLRQYRNRNFKTINHSYSSKLSTSIEKREEQQYLSNPDEIDAYSWNIAVRYYIKETRLNTKKLRESYDLKAYHKAFGKQHEVVSLLKSKIEKNLQTIREASDGKNRKSIFRTRVGRRRNKSS